jgi:arylformamidase
MIYDISTPISDSTPVYPGDPPVRIKRISDLADQGECTLSEITMSLHAGTHIDAPSHFIAGAPNVESIPLDLLIGDATLVDISNAGAITADTLDKLDIPPTAIRLLLRTPDSKQETALTACGAQWIVGREIKLIGIDRMTIGFAQDNAQAHRTLLIAGTVILESLNLSAPPAGCHKLICLPLNLTGTEAAPTRAILLD